MALNRSGLRSTRVTTGIPAGRLMERASSLGVSHVTHLFNAMRPLHHREPGLIGYVLRNPEMTADIIVDGVHLHSGIVDLALICKGADKLLLITDAMRAACMGDGEYEIGGLEVHVEHGVARIQDGTLAGSTVTIRLVTYILPSGITDQMSL